MLQVSVFNEYAQEYDAWFEKYANVYESELIAIKQQLLKLPENISGVEIGVGAGRFAEPLGIRDGVEPSEEMSIMATKRGVEVMNAVAEDLPYKDMHFDFVLFVTICHLDHVPTAFKEAWRVLKPGGSIIVGFIDKNGEIGKEYEARRPFSHFYKQATFYSVDRVRDMLTEVGFKDLEFTQTLFGKLDDIQEVQAPKEGFGEGSFVVVKATKKG